MDTTETAPCRFCHNTITRVVPSPFAKLVRWAVSDPIVPADSPHAYEYLIVAHAA